MIRAFADDRVRDSRASNSADAGGEHIEVREGVPSAAIPMFKAPRRRAPFRGARWR